MFHFRHVIQPILFISVTLRYHTNDESGDAQKIVSELDGHRSHELAEFPRDPYRISEDRYHAHDHERGETRDGVNRVKMGVIPFSVVHQAHANQVEDEPDRLQNPVQMLVGAT